VLELLVLLAVIVIMLASAILIFMAKRLMRAVICLAMVALGASALFLYLGQELVALLQLFVFVGCLATYLMVAVASEEKQAKRTGILRFIFVIVVVFIAVSLSIKEIAGGQQTGNDFASEARAVFESQYAFLYAAVFMLFASAIGSVVVIRRFSGRVV